LSTAQRVLLPVVTDPPHARPPVRRDSQDCNYVRVIVVMRSLLSRGGLSTGRIATDVWKTVTSCRRTSNEAREVAGRLTEVSPPDPRRRGDHRERTEQTKRRESAVR
jgi:hypothetical protein